MHWQQISLNNFMLNTHDFMCIIIVGDGTAVKRVKLRHLFCYVMTTRVASSCFWKFFYEISCKHNFCVSIFFGTEFNAEILYIVTSFRKLSYNMTASSNRLVMFPKGQGQPQFCSLSRFLINIWLLWCAH